MVLGDRTNRERSRSPKVRKVMEQQVLRTTRLLMTHAQGGKPHTSDLLRHRHFLIYWCMHAKESLILFQIFGY